MEVKKVPVSNAAVSPFQHKFDTAEEIRQVLSFIPMRKVSICQYLPKCKIWLQTNTPIYSSRFECEFTRQCVRTNVKFRCLSNDGLQIWTSLPVIIDCAVNVFSMITKYCNIEQHVLMLYLINEYLITIIIIITTIN